MKIIKKKLLLLVVSIIISLLLAEILMRIYYGATDKVIGIDEEEKCNREQYRLLGDESNPARFSPNHLGYHEYWNYSGVRPTANVRGNQIVTKRPAANLRGNQIVTSGTEKKRVKFYKFYNINTNSQHMRALRDYNIIKPDGTKRMVILGDSFAWGDEVPLMFSIPAVLETLTSNSEVLNMGIKGTGIGNMYLRWKYDALNYNPDIVILAPVISDLPRISPCIYKPKFNIINGKLEISNMPPPTFREIYENYKLPIFESYLTKHILYNIKYFGGVERKKYKYGLERFDLILDEMKDESQENGRYFLVLMIEQSNNNIRTEDDIYALQKTRQMLVEKEIPFLFSNDVFQRESYDLQSEDTMQSFDKNRTNNHFTPRGYAYLAQGIKNKLEDDGIIKKEENFNFRFNSSEYVLFLHNKQNSSDVRIIFPYNLI